MAVENLYHPIFRCEAKEWLDEASGPNWLNYPKDDIDAIYLVDDLYSAGAVNVEVAGSETKFGADALYVELPEDREKVIRIMVLLAKQHGDNVFQVITEKSDFALIHWTNPLRWYNP